MSNALIAFFISIPMAVWIYSKMARQSAGNLKPPLIVSAVCAVVMFIVVWTVLNMVLNR